MACRAAHLPVSAEPLRESDFVLVIIYPFFRHFGVRRSVWRNGSAWHS